MTLISADRVLSILQFLLVFFGVAIWGVLLLPANHACPEEGCVWTYTYPDGQQIEAQTPQQPEDVYDWIASFLIVTVCSLWSFGISAILFCLRRIAAYLKRAEKLNVSEST